LLKASTLVLALAAAGCSVHSFEKIAMAGAYRPDAPPAPKDEPAPRYQLFAGDMHCHVSPPDSSHDVSRGVAETIALAKEEGLDFVVLTPHLPGRFFTDEKLRAFAATAQKELSRALAERGGGGTIFVPGFEYTDARYGHISASFADLGAVLDAVPLDVARKEPERFFERWVERGGVLVVNHPLLTSLASLISSARADMSWRPWTSADPVPPEIGAAARLTIGFEAYNVAVTHLRDRFLLGDTEWSVREVLGRLDREIASARRRLSPFGGSDSHSGFLRATTFVLAEARTEAAIRDAIVNGRVCVRSPEACSFEARAPGGSWVGVGGALRSDGVVEVRARGNFIVIARDGAPVAMPASGAITRVDVPARACSILRARVGEGFSAPLYVNCDFAAPPP
jgi:hypothetical protein